jgi:putative Mg2+ transporter-C (MgtC) family protein
MDFTRDYILDNSIKLLVSLLLGAVIGAEREYKGRNIGFRTIILITLGSTLFTILSFTLGAGTDPSRIASNIVTGVGFLGAGAIFREGANVKGITTAAIIWISAAIGMACGTEQYEFATLVTGFVLFVLLGFTGVQRFIDNYNKELVYHITISNDLGIRANLEKSIAECKLKFYWLRQVKEDGDLMVSYEIRGAEKNHERFISLLSVSGYVKRFEV